MKMPFSMLNTLQILRTHNTNNKAGRRQGLPKGFYLARELLELLQALSLYKAQLDKIVQM